MGSAQWGHLGLLALIDFHREIERGATQDTPWVATADAVYCTRSITGRFITAH
jgi:hypothetical protein